MRYERQFFRSSFYAMRLSGHPKFKLMKMKAHVFKLIACFLCELQKIYKFALAI